MFVKIRITIEIIISDLERCMHFINAIYEPSNIN